MSSYELPILQKVINEFTKFPYIGHKNASKLVYYFLKNAPYSFEKFHSALEELKNNVFFCKECRGFSEKKNICDICKSENRNKKILCIVETPFEIITIEKLGIFDGVYWVLHGKINPLEGIMPSNLKIENLIDKIKKDKTEKIIFALDWDMESETTIHYIIEKTKEIPTINFFRISPGISIGSYYGNIDDFSLKNSFKTLYEIKI